MKAIRSKGYEIVDFNDIKTEEASNFYMRQVSYCGESKDDLKKVERSSDCEGTLLKAVGVEIISADESFKTEVLSAPFKKPRYTYQFQSFGLEEKILNFPSITRYHQAHRKFVKRSLEASKRIPHCNDLRI